MHGVAQRIHDRADLGGDAVQLHDVARGHRDEVGKRAVAVDANDLGALAEMTGTEAALEAVPADDVALGGDQVAGGEQARGLGLASERDDLARELVADDHRRLEPVAGPAVPFPDVQVGAADAGEVDADEDVARPVGGRRTLPQHHSRPGSLLHESAHAVPGMKSRGI